MPLNLAVLGSNRADGAREAFPAIESWAVGGHSLGGAMACRYAADNTDELNGLVLHASYCDRDVSESGLRVLPCWGRPTGCSTPSGNERAARTSHRTRGSSNSTGSTTRDSAPTGHQRGDRPVTTEPAAMRERVGNATGAWLAG